MNTIFKRSYTKRGFKSQRKVKSFEDKDVAMKYGWDLAYANTDNEVSYYIITEDKKCLRFNKTIIL